MKNLVFNMHSPQRIGISAFAVMLFLLAACQQTTTIHVVRATVVSTTTTATATATAIPIVSPTPVPLPSGTYVVYATQSDSTMYVNLQNGQSFQGPFAGLSDISIGSNTWYAYSTNGKFGYLDVKFGYSDGQTLIIQDLVHESYSRISMPFVTDRFWWSPDNSRIAFYNDNRTIDYISLQNSSILSTVPNTGLLENLQVVGWHDENHLVIIYDNLDQQASATIQQRNVALYSAPGGNPHDASKAVIALLDVNTGATTILTKMNGTGIVQYNFSLSPDGKEVLLQNAFYNPSPYTPFLEVIDTTTGSVISLPNTLQALGDLSYVAWRPGKSYQFLTSSNKRGGIWLVNAQSDAAQPIINGVNAQIWAPDGKTFIMSSPAYAVRLKDPITITAVTLNADNSVAKSWQVTQTARIFSVMGIAVIP